ncbi:YfhO family protein [Bacillus sp. DNRA2]|uniref:YfhO family protein n=1 Tax=Bacillus sp. DNRA2 TaxID=2723053 RepID=UPI00145FC37D|nr:YfhO family protein [Bacillus sp. DNRA2]NMD68805.1 YfhO family protein [Bacillus sp. DNRA2]
MKKVKPILIFLIPIFIVLAVFFIFKITPFGPSSIWYIDLPAQIILFYSHLYDVFRGQESILFTWNYGMGINFWATFCYYLSSPLSFLIVFFPRDLIPQAVIMIYLIKLGLASLFMSVMLRKLYDINDMKAIVFSISYSLMSFSITYYFLPMWIDAIYLLPLLILSVHFILKENKYKLFLITLTILFFSNFYISYITGIFIFLYFVKEMYLGDFSKKEVFQKCKIFFTSVFLAASFSMVMILPTYLQLKSNSYSNSDHALMGFGINPLDIYQKLFIGTTELQNLSLYVGLIVLLLVPLYFFNKKYPLRERIADLLLLSFLLISIASNLLIYIWHVFEMPNGAFYRFAFLISFYLILLSVKSIIALDKQMLPLLIKIYVFNCVLISLLNKLLSQDFFGLSKMYLNLFILTAIFIILGIKMNKQRLKVPSLINFTLLVVVMFDLFFNTYYIFRNYIPASSPLDKIYNSTYRNVIEQIGKTDSGLYRISPDNDLLSTENESLKYQYKGMSIYSSTGNGNLNNYLGSLGYASSTRNVNMKNGIFVSDSLFGFKYKITTSPKDSRIYEEVYKEGNILAYKNKYSMPIGFMVNNNQVPLVNDTSNWIEKQNGFLGSIDGKSNYYEKVDSDNISINNLRFDSDAKVYHMENQQVSAYLEYQVKVTNLRQLYLQLGDEEYLNADQLFTISVNGKKLSNAKVGLLNSFDLGTFENEDVIVKIEFTTGTAKISQPELYTLNYSLMGKRIEELNQNPLIVTKYNNHVINGKITVHDGEVLFLSIPYDHNWHVKVDGKQVDTIQLGEFIGVPITKGYHELVLQYTPKEIYISIAYSLVVLLLFVSYILIFERNKKGISIFSK